MQVLRYKKTGQVRVGLAHEGFRSSNKVYFYEIKSLNRQAENKARQVENQARQVVNKARQTACRAEAKGRRAEERARRAEERARRAGERACRVEEIVRRAEETASWTINRQQIWNQHLTTIQFSQ